MTEQAPEYSTGLQGSSMQADIRGLVSEEMERISNMQELEQARSAIQENQVIKEALTKAGISVVEQEDGGFEIELPNTSPVQEQVNQAQVSQASVGGISSGTPAPQLTLEDVDNLSPDEINDRWDEISQLMKGSK